MRLSISIALFDVLRRRFTLILACFLLMILSSISTAIMYQMKILPVQLIQIYREVKEEIAGIAESITPALIFRNNARVALITYLSVIPRGIPIPLPFVVTISELVLNGAMVSLAILDAISSGISLGQAIILIIPHGILEFLAISISAAGGLMLWLGLVSFFFDRNRSNRIIRDSLILVSLSILIFGIAALVEFYITLPLAKSMLAAGGWKTL